MRMEQIKLLGLIIGVTLVSGIADAQGFIHAGKIWQGGTAVPSEVAKSAVGFGIGLVTYWLALKYMQGFGIVAPEVQTAIWFSVTLIGVAFISGQFFRWPLLEQAVAIAVLLGMSWLMFRTGA